MCIFKVDLKYGYLVELQVKLYFLIKFHRKYHRKYQKHPTCFIYTRINRSEFVKTYVQLCTDARVYSHADVIHRMIENVESTDRLRTVKPSLFFLNGQNSCNCRVLLERVLSPLTLAPPSTVPIDTTDAFCAVLCCAALTGMMGVPGVYRARTVPDRVPYRWAVIPYKVYALRS